MNKTIIQFFEWYAAADGKHWVHFQQQAQQLLDLGITDVWLPPAYKGTRGDKSEGYDVYDIYDLGEFHQKDTVRTKYGTKQEYVDAITHARSLGLRVIIDVVLNHMGGAELTEKIRVRKVDPLDRTKFISEPFEIEAYTLFQFKGRNHQHSDFRWDHHCFTGVDHAVGVDEPAIYTILNEYGAGWEPLVDTEMGNFDYLILNDIETRNPAVREELRKWARWYYQTVPYDGVRLDAVKHMNPSFFNEWLDYVRTQLNPDLFALGEYWLSDDLPVLLKYLEATGERMSLFDAPLHHNFSEASRQRERYDLREIFHDSLVAVKTALAVTFVDNHDTQPLQSLEEYTEQWFKPHAYALILLREAGVPCVFYPDLYGTNYSGQNKSGEDCSICLPVLPELPVLMQLRKTHAYGTQQDYFDSANCIGFTRLGDGEHSGCAVLLSNDPVESCSRRMYMGKRFANSYFYNCLDERDEPVQIDAEGFGIFRVSPSAVSVWIER